MVEKDILAHIDENEESVGRFCDNLVDVREKPDRTNPKIESSNPQSEFESDQIED